MYTKARKIVYEAMEDNAVSGATYEKLGLRWVRDAVLHLGVMPEYYVQVEEIDLTDSHESFMKPDNLISTRAVYLCKDGELIEAVYTGKRPSGIFDPDGCCDFYKNTRGYEHPLLGEDDQCFFFTGGSHSGYSKALIEYNGLLHDEDGNVKVPTIASEAVKSYISFKIAYRERKRDRNKVTQQEVENDKAEWLRQTGIAYGRLKTPSKAIMDEWVRKNWYSSTMRTPKLRLRQRYNE